MARLLLTLAGFAVMLRTQDVSAILSRVSARYGLLKQFQLQAEIEISDSSEPSPERQHYKAGTGPGTRRRTPRQALERIRPGSPPQQRHSYLESSTAAEEAKLKFSGGKTDCWVIRITAGATTSQLYISQDDHLVLRHTNTVRVTAAHQVVIDNCLRSLDESAPADLFDAPVAGRQFRDMHLPSEHDADLVGTEARDFTLQNRNGQPVHLADLRGKPLLLDFWATWCPPCRHELPSLEAVSIRYQGQAVVLGVNSESVKVADGYLEKHHPALESLHDDKAKVERQYNIYAVPTVSVIDSNGKMVAQLVGDHEEKDLGAVLRLAGIP